MFFAPTAINKFDSVDFNFIRTKQSEHTFYITLNRPEKRNAFTPAMVNELAFALSYANAQKDIWCIVIQANGSVFCAGMDLNVFQNPVLDMINEQFPEPLKNVSLGEVFRFVSKPTIAKLEGNVYAGGFLIVCGCTFVVAAENVEFSLPEVKCGLFPMQVIAALSDCMPPRRALQLCISGEALDAKTALAAGLVSHLCVKENINEKLAELVHTIIENSPYAIGKGIETFRALSNIPEKEKFGFLMQQLIQIRQSNDAQEGINAFKEKRKPVWSNS